MIFIFTLSFIMSYTINNISVGIPAGTIFASAAHTTDPPGYVIADGIERTDGADGRYNNLIDLTIGLGTLTKNAASYTPINLKAAFLRATSNQTINNVVYTGKAIKSYQHTAMTHTHPADSTDANGDGHTHATASTAGNTADNTQNAIGVGIIDGDYTENTDNDSQSGQVNVHFLFSFSFTDENNSQTGTSNNGGDSTTETAPFCYGVNWLIKL